MDIGQISATLGSAASTLAAIVALIIAAAALRATRRAAIAGQLLEALSELIASLQAISDRAMELNHLGREGEAKSRDTLRPDFRRLTVANARVALLEPSLSKDDAYGQWVRDTASNMAVNLLQADEFADWSRQVVASDAETRKKPDWATSEEWRYLRRSIAFYSVEAALADLPMPPLPAGVRPLDKTWAPRIVAAMESDFDSVYSLKSSYMVQNARLLDDFSREYLVPWASAFVGRGILGRKVGGA